MVRVPNSCLRLTAASRLQNRSSCRRLLRQPSGPHLLSPCRPAEALFPHHRGPATLLAAELTTQSRHHTVSTPHSRGRLVCFHLRFNLRFNQVAANTPWPVSSQPQLLSNKSRLCLRGHHTMLLNKRRPWVGLGLTMAHGWLVGGFMKP